MMVSFVFSILALTLLIVAIGLLLGYAFRPRSRR